MIITRYETSRCRSCQRQAWVVRWLILPGPLAAATSLPSFSLDFIAAARATDVIGVGRVLRRGRSLVNCEAEIVDPDGKLLAKALAVYEVG